MDDIGFQGTGSRFNTRFGSGEDIYASQLNGLASGIQSALGMPYLGAGQSVSFVPGGNLITGPSPVEAAIGAAVNINFGPGYVNHYQIQVGTLFLGTILVPTPTLKIAKGGNVWRPENTDCPAQLWASQIYTDGSITVVPGADPTSVWASNDGYIVMAPGETYYCYSFHVETEFASFFYIYVSTSASLTGGCPMTLPTGIPEPTTPYTVNGILLGSATYTLPFFPLVQQFVVGSITWPNLPGGAGTEYVNHYETAVKTMTIGDTPTKVLKVGRGGNIWNPSPSTDQKPLEKRADVITTDPAFGITVAGMDVNSPWASDDGYVELAGVSAYVYAFKVVSAGGAVTDFYIYVSGSSTLVDGSPVTLPAGITPPTGPYTVQGLRVADAVWNGISSDFDVSQRVVGSITWPDYVPPRVVQQFECVVESLPTESGFVDALRIAKGDILWTNSRFRWPGYSITPYQGHVEKLWVYPTGSVTSDVNPALPWVNGGGYVTLDREKTYKVYFIGNQDVYDYPGLAVIADGSDAATKSRPFASGYMGRVMQNVFWNEEAFTVDDAPYYQQVFAGTALLNFNCQRYLVATLAWGGSAWNVTQYLYGPVTMSDDLTSSGPLSAMAGYEPVTNFYDNQVAWIGDWSGSVKAGDPYSCLTVVWSS